MTKQTITDHTIDIINQLPDDKAAEISDLADFLIKRYEELHLTEGIQKLTSGQSFDFLKDEEDLYTKSDLKETYTTRASLDFSSYIR